jgi:hypothetical protein
VLVLVSSVSAILGSFLIPWALVRSWIEVRRKRG